MYEPRCSITVGGSSRNSGWLRSNASRSLAPAPGCLVVGIDMKVTCAQRWFRSIAKRAKSRRFAKPCSPPVNTISQ